jgi:hypothetical protein
VPVGRLCVCTLHASYVCVCVCVCVYVCVGGLRAAVLQRMLTSSYSVYVTVSLTLTCSLYAYGLGMVSVFLSVCPSFAHTNTHIHSLSQTHSLSLSLSLSVSLYAIVQPIREGPDSCRHADGNGGGAPVPPSHLTQVCVTHT